MIGSEIFIGLAIPSLIAAGGLGQYLIWGVGGVLAAAAVVAILVWRGRKRWPVLAALARHPFAKYVVLSLIAHIGLVIWLLSSSLFNPPDLPGPPAVVVRIGTDSGTRDEHRVPDKKPWDVPDVEAVSPPEPELDTPTPEQAKPVDRPPPPEPQEELSTQLPIAELPETHTNALSTQAVPAVPIQPGQPPTKPVSSAVDVASRNDQPLQEPAQETTQSESPLPDTPPPTQSFSQNRTQQFEQGSEQPPSPSQVHPMETFATAPSDTQPEKGLHTATLGSPVNDLAQQFPPASSFTEPRQTDRNHVQTLPVSAKTAASPSTRPTPARIDSRAMPSEILTTQKQAQAAAEPTDQYAVTHQADRHQHAPIMESLPPIYHDRLSNNRLSIARARGGSINTERAVQAALRWLAKAQSDDGRWDASQFGSGRPTFEGGHDRRGAGQNADTGTTGLAILAYLGSGQTHQYGEHSEVVKRGLDFLIASQRHDGSLSGNAQLYAAMYCHGIAFLALSEAFSLTGDEAIRPAVESALRYTLAMQHPTTGGWRYRRGEEGDTSQLGWQLMALTSAHYAGMRIPGTTWTRAERFVQSVTSRDGRASYRPGQLPSSAMTAEAMLCRLFLGTPTTDPQIQSAARYVSSELPGFGRTNYYYWYYGTLALYHLQDDNWRRWNTAVKKQLVGRQQGDGSWSAASVWGTSGGKVYSTALGALTLEVYYRYRPLARPATPSHQQPQQTIDSARTARKGI